ncbi:mechanosensitive ion channel family protein [Zobellella maritima]|uniref:mechanosensitive ion channel family protein n=1 Tax=Zobellella maritima TaxID=2059725 RepID=UPI000E305D6F|nr:mechanosensitive ion channel domain-containing protein [Zobellella maritima]
MEEKLAQLLEHLPLWFEQILSATVLYQLIVLLLAALGGLAVNRLASRLLHLDEGTPASGLRHVTRRTVQKVVFPLSMLLWGLLGKGALMLLALPVVLIDIVVPLLLSLVLIRILVYLLRKGFPPTPMLLAWENIVSTGIWLVVALHLLGWLPAVTETLDAVAFDMGRTRISLLSTIKLVVLVALLLTLAFWISGLLERRMKLSAYMAPSMQVAFAKFSKFFLITLAFLLAIDAVGIDLTALAVFGGALGVGIGFGLQRIASNFISGFILVLDRSIKPGDVITVGGQFGRVEELRARYVVVKSRAGVETLIPNENLIISEVINWSYTDPYVRISIPVQVSYDDDPEQAMALMLETIQTSPRVLAYPESTVQLRGFGESGIDLELRIWIRDPEAGVGNIRSQINLAIWRAFKQAGITIPYPQRDLHIKSAPHSLTEVAPSAPEEP